MKKTVEINTYLVATNSDYTVLVIANSEREAEHKANLFYFQEYGETRDDWSAYEIKQYLIDGGGVMPIRSWYSEVKLN